MRVRAFKIVLGAVLLLSLCAVSVPNASAIPAFARKYGLPCSACHEGWPVLNNFGQVFKDNGYQLMNEKDSPIYQNPAYFPITFRITPNWHRETTNRTAVDSVPGDATSGLIEKRITTSGFDLSGFDMWSGGTLYKNISFILLPSSDATGAFHFESAYVRFDNLLGSRWLNFKFGKFELDMPISEKRFLTISAVGGAYQNYHFVPVTDINTFGGVGNNQLGIELMGHSKNSYTRYSVAMLSSQNGNVGLPNGHTYDLFENFTQGFEIPHLGLQRLGVFGYQGHSPTQFQTSGGVPIPGTGFASKPFYRSGAYGIFYLGDFDLYTLFMHGSDNRLLGACTTFSVTLPACTGTTPVPSLPRAPTWNGGFAELHYVYNPQLVLVGRLETVRMSQQAFPDFRGNLGNTNSWVVGYRWYPIMFSRAGLAWHQEYAHTRITGVSPVTGRDQVSNSFFMGWDFDF